MIGGTTHLESFDPKPTLNKYAGMSIAESPYKDVLTSPFSQDNLRAAKDVKQMRGINILYRN